MTEAQQNRLARQRVIDEIRRHMVGPVSEDEILTDYPWEFYHAGILWPVGTQHTNDENDHEDEAGEEGAAEGLFDLANSAKQSAIGLTCFVSEDETHIGISADWAIYLAESDSHSWLRVPDTFTDSIDITELKDGELKTVFPNRSHPNNDVCIKIRKKRINDTLSLTITMISKRRASETAVFGEGNIYQAVLTAESNNFVQGPVSDFAGRDPEYWQHELIYRHAVHYANGHGCAVTWDGKAVRPEKISTDWIPEEEVLKASPDICELNGSPVLDMNFLGNAPLADVLHELSFLSSTYAAWINGEQARTEDIIASFPDARQDSIRAAALDNIENCRQQLRRMNEGIQALESTPPAFLAFQLANRTIAENLEISTHKAGREMTSPPEWRPFQLAFILLALPSSVDHRHPDRDIMELIWFPTGGGKTEAYLGLTALLMFWRQLTAETPDEAAGTAVITRYTLRLLTVQQFERAVIMICAANRIRKTVPEIRELPEFTAGLFVGDGATPNRLEKAQELIDNHITDDTQTTLPLKDCPVCGHPLSTCFQKVQGNEMHTWCPNKDCEYSAGNPPLPVAVIDEHIYSHPPTFVIGTVDKFANMATEPRIARLLGKGEHTGRLQLIIQDELHLISDALGTVTALYETAVDHICRYEGRPVKIIGSTATIRRAEQQIRAIYNRGVMQFPPPCLDADNSFFYRSDTKNPGRLYVGLHAQGRSPKHTLARLTGNSLQASCYLDEKTRDPFHTLVMYFNSLRELGGTLLLLEDDVPRYLESLNLPDGQEKRANLRYTELTSKLKSSDIPEILSALSVCWSSGEYYDREPIDTVLATNMISVGVDVGRLGMMIVNGQPKNTAEYIQASSRVGRPTGSAGLVLTLYNWTRPRDRSHYERFSTYHRAFYRHVESSSVTPFASRARDRALHAVLISIVRQTMPEFGPNDSAVRITEQPLRNRVRELIRIIADRCRDTDRRENPEHVREHLEKVLDDWLSLAEKTETLNWRKNKKNDPVPHLLKQQDMFEEKWRIPGSLRDVEAPVNIEMKLRTEP
ncbi:helicase-related protein [Photobacterium nomapromontoriensis]|uniref:helicase-related protein n=1 Tax=Photobacterium nomapromontoriensis TaxID=2910237 RepID=UPI003D0E3DEC